MHDPSGPKDANDALLRGLDIQQLIKDCTTTLNDRNLLMLSDLKDKVLTRIVNANQIQGVASTCFQFYNKMVKGLRRGEFTLVTGASGSGKTTFLSQLSIDFVQQGIPTLWGSFEIKNEILAHTMLSQYCCEKLTPSKGELAIKYLEEFEQMPLHFMNFYGSTSMEDVFSTLEYAVYAHDISLICIDNMQFMLSDQAQGYQKFDLQDKVTSLLRKVATELDVHVCLVVHPKKVEDDTQLSAGSIFGSAKTSQEADNVLILQKSADIPGYRMLQVVKNRYDGEVGQAGLAFNKDTKRYLELNKIERDLFAKEEGDVTKLLERR